MTMTRQTRWLAAAGLGLALTATLTPLAAMSRPNPTTADVMTAATIIGPVAFAVSWLALVAGPVLARSYAEGNVERTWLERALAGTAVDVLGGIAVAALTLTTNDIHAPAGPALTIVLAAGLADLGLRYLRLRQS
jgi:hypothetical protein